MSKTLLTGTSGRTTAWQGGACICPRRGRATGSARPSPCCQTAAADLQRGRDSFRNKHVWCHFGVVRSEIGNLGWLSRTAKLNQLFIWSQLVLVFHQKHIGIPRIHFKLVTSLRSNNPQPSNSERAGGGG